MAPEFKMQLYTDPINYEESPLVDRKVTCEFGKEGKKQEFINDIISLANSARMLGRDAYLLFGIDDKTQQIIGIDPPEDTKLPNMWKYFFDRTKKNKSNQNKSNQDEYFIPNDCLVWEEIKHTIQDIIKDHITPIVVWELDHTPDGEEKKLFYIRIHFKPGELFRKSANVGERPWIRFGESKQQILDNPYNSEMLGIWPYSANEFPFIFPSQFIHYLDNLIKRIQADYFRIDETIYQDLHNSENITYLSLIDEFIEQNDNQLLVITGSVGTGKTTLLSKYLIQKAKDSISAFTEVVIREEYFPPPDINIPAYISLRGSSILGYEELVKMITNVINGGIFWSTIHPSKRDILLNYPNLKWIIGLDGLDEIWNKKNREGFCDALKAFLYEYPNIKIILTSRPNVACSDWVSWNGKLLNLTPLTNNQIGSYLSSSLPGEMLSFEKLDQLISYIGSKKDLYVLLSNPLCLTSALSVLTEYIQQDEQQDELLFEEIQEPLPQGNQNSDDEISYSEDIITLNIAVSDPEIEKVPSLTSNQNEPFEEYRNPGKTKDGEDAPQRDRGDNNALIVLSKIIPKNTPDLHQMKVGKITHTIYENIKNREFQRRNDENIKLWWFEIGSFALKLDGKFSSFTNKDFPKKLKKNKTVGWLLGVGIITESCENPDSFEFQTNLTKEYFAARFILATRRSPYYPEVAKMILKSKKEFRTNVNNLIIDIDPSFQW